MKNDKGGGRGLISFLPLKRGKSLLEGGGLFERGELNREFTVCSLIHGVLEKTCGSLHLFAFNVQLEKFLYSTVKYHYC